MTEIRPVLVSPSFQQKASGAFWREALPEWVPYTEALVQEVLPSHVPPTPSHEPATRLPHRVNKKELPDTQWNLRYLWVGLHDLQRSIPILTILWFCIWRKKRCPIEFKSSQCQMKVEKDVFGLQLGPGFQGGVTPNDVVLSMHCSSVNEKALF